MTGIDRLSSAPPVSALAATPGGDAGSVAARAIGEIGHRALAWVGASGGSAAGATAWGDVAGGATGFAPDAATLARRGDIYGLDDMARGIAGQFGATPTQEGELRRAMEGFTRAAVVQIAGLSGADGNRQVAGLADAFAAAGSAHGNGGIDDVVGRFAVATATLARTGG